MASEANRRIAFQCPLEDEKLLIRHVHGNESLGSCFEYVLTLYSLDDKVEADSLLGQHATVSVQDGSAKPRFFDGIATEFAHTGYAGRYASYRMVLRPWLWLLSRNQTYSIFQNQTTPDIVRTVFGRWGDADFEDYLIGSFAPRTYCVQYQESDLAFVSRLLEDEGIYFYFRHEAKRHVLVLADSMDAHDIVRGLETMTFRRSTSPDAPHGAADSIHAWSSTKRVQAGRVALKAYDFKKPRAKLEAARSDPEVHDYPKAELFSFSGRYTEANAGEKIARTRVEELLANCAVAEASTMAPGLLAGAKFKLANHPRSDQNREYLIVGLSFDADSGRFESGSSSATHFAAQLRAIPCDVTFRPRRVSPRPIALGPETATVVGPRNENNSPKNELWTDEYGQVKVQFHWDRESRSNEDSSCWIRVAQGWAGGGWGSQFIPRVGQEVIVEFLGGDPDRPLITGSVYNDANRPPYTSSERQTQSGFKTQSTPHGGVNDYNELRFDDKKDLEQVFLQAQRDLSINTKHDSVCTTGHDHTQRVSNDLTVEVQKGFHQITVREKDMITDVKRADYVLHARRVTEDAEQKVELMVHGCTITIDPERIELSAHGSTIALSAEGIQLSALGHTLALAATGLSLDALGNSIGLSASGLSINSALKVEING